MAIDFPNSPTTNQTFTVGTRTWIWDGTTWELVATSSDPIQKTIVDAKGDLIAGTTSDAVARLAVGTNGHVLTADSTTATGLKWAAASGGGKVLQVVQATTSTPVTIASTSLTDTGLSATITPSSTSSKVLIYANHVALSSRSGASVYAGLELLRGSTVIWDDGTNNQRALSLGAGGTTNVNIAVPITCIYLDSPNTTSATTYKTQSKVNDTSNGGQVLFQSDNGISTMILMEIGA